jgi:hypothetical protein
MATSRWLLHDPCRACRSVCGGPVALPCGRGAACDRAPCPGGREGALLRLRSGGRRGQLPAQGSVQVPGAPLRRHQGLLRPAQGNAGSRRILADPPGSGRTGRQHPPAVRGVAPAAPGLPDLSGSPIPGAGARVDGVGSHGESREARDRGHRSQPADQPRRRSDERLHHHHPVAGPPRGHPR